MFLFYITVSLVDQWVVSVSIRRCIEARSDQVKILQITSVVIQTRFQQKWFMLEEDLFREWWNRYIYLHCVKKSLLWLIEGRISMVIYRKLFRVILFQKEKHFQCFHTNFLCFISTMETWMFSIGIISPFTIVWHHILDILYQKRTNQVFIFFIFYKSLRSNLSNLLSLTGVTWTKSVLENRKCFLWTRNKTSIVS